MIGTSYLRPGALKLKNMNDDNVIDAKDRTVIGNTNPKASGGFSLSGRVYGFDLSANFTYSIGNDVYNANKIEYTSSYQYYYRNMLDIMGEDNWYLSHLNYLLHLLSIPIFHQRHNSLQSRLLHNDHCLYNHKFRQPNDRA